VEVGDRFVMHSMLGSWVLTITKVEPEWSLGRLEPEPVAGGDPARIITRLPERGMGFTLVP